MSDEYDLDRDTTRELAIEAMKRVFDISADGRTLLVLTYAGRVLYDVVADPPTRVQGMTDLEEAQLLARP